MGLSNIQTIRKHIPKEWEGSYFEIPFSVPEQTERIDVEYSYTRKRDTEDGGWTRSREINVIDLAVSAPQGEYIGSSGSDRTHVWISAAGSADGYAAAPTVSGTWSIIVGAYKISDGGADVTYTVTCRRKTRRLFLGDTHIHTTGSDGVFSVGEIAAVAKRLGLDYIFITDHNNFAHNFLNPEVKGITVLPGTEWTHYKGHCGMLGVKRPFRSAFCVNCKKEAVGKLEEAKQSGAILVQNHPFCPFCGWRWGDYDEFPFDLLEIWNGGVVPRANEDCLVWWQGRLERGEKIPVVGGSDFHRPEPMRMVGNPSTCVYALSRAPKDLLEALKKGNSYVSFSPNGPGVSARAGDKILGETAAKGSPVSSRFFGLKDGDRVLVILGKKTEEVSCADGADSFVLEFDPGTAPFCRFEVRRRSQPGFPEMPAMISNPIYFE